MNRADSQDFPKKLDNVITSVKAYLAKVMEERAAALQKLHFVKIELPQTLNLLNQPQPIIQTAYECLHVAFSRAVDAKSNSLVSKDLSTICDGANQTNQGLLDRLIDRLSAALRKPIPPAKAGTNGVDCFSLEFAVSAKLDDGSDRLQMLKPIFAEVATELSGTTLTKDICHRLSPDYFEPDNPPQGHYWINVHTPYEHI